MRRPETTYRPESTTVSDNRKSTFFQPKLTVGHVNDAYEREADAQADRVMHMPDNENHFFHAAPAMAGTKLQLKGGAGAGGGLAASTTAHSGVKSGGQPLDAGTRNFFEPRFGCDFGNVQIHNDPAANQSSSQMNALAYTYGNHIVFGEGQYQPDTISGKQLLAHELAHTIQQKQNTVFRKPRNFGGTVSNEKEDSAYDFYSVYQLSITDKEAVITINLKLIPDKGVTKQELEDVKFQTKSEFLRYWNNRFTLTNSDGDKIPLRVRLNYVDVLEELAVHLHKGSSAKRTVVGDMITIKNETEDLENWFVDSPAVVRAHELGHQLGMLDEYVDPNSANRETEDSPGVFDKDHSLMSSPESEGIELADVRIRHGNTLATDISNATNTKYTAAWSDTYFVQHGDTMKKIAMRIYGDEKKWKDIYELNKSKIKNFTLEFGQQIILPPRT